MNPGAPQLPQGPQVSHALQPVTQARELTFMDGARALFRGVGYVIRTPDVWMLAIVPAFIGVVLVVGVTAGGFFLGQQVIERAIPTTDTSAVSSVLAFFASVLLFLLSLIVGLVLGLSLAQPLSAPALDALAKKRALALGVTTFVDTPVLPAMARSLRVVGLALVVGLPILLLLSFITLVFPAAAVVTFPLKFGLAAWLAAWDIFDYPFAFEAMGVRARLAWLSRNGMAAFAFGLAFAAVALVPALGLFVIPFGVAGATDLWVLSRQSGVRRR